MDASCSHQMSTQTTVIQSRYGSVHDINENAVVSIKQQRRYEVGASDLNNNNQGPMT